MGLYEGIKKNYNRKTNFKLNESSKGKKKRVIKEAELDQKTINDIIKKLRKAKSYNDVEYILDDWDGIGLPGKYFDIFDDEMSSNPPAQDDDWYYTYVDTAKEAAIDALKADYGIKESCGGKKGKKKLNESLEPGWFTANKEEVDKLYKMAVGSDNLDYIKEQLDAIYAIAKKEITGNVNESCDKEEIKESIYELSPEYGGRQSYYGKAQVETNNGESTLYSYGTPIMKINSNGEIEMLCSERHLTNTTIRHIREFMQQNGFSPIPKQKLISYINSGEKIVESCKKEPVKEAGSKEGAAKRKINRRKKNIEWLKSQLDKKPMSDLSKEDKDAISNNLDKSLATYKESCKGRKRKRKNK